MAGVSLFAASTLITGASTISLNRNKPSSAAALFPRRKINDRLNGAATTTSTMSEPMQFESCIRSVSMISWSVCWRGRCCCEVDQSESGRIQAENGLRLNHSHDSPKLGIPASPPTKP